MTQAAALISKCFLLSMLILFPWHIQGEENSRIPTFTPPTKWVTVDASLLAPSVKVSFSTKSQKDFNPSINLSEEKTTLTCKEYIKAVQKMYESDCSNRWRNLGNIETKAGKALLTSIETETPLGKARIFQLFFLENGTAYIVTAAALQEEFGMYQKTFLDSFASFCFIPSKKDTDLQAEKAK